MLPLARKPGEAFEVYKERQAQHNKEFQAKQQLAIQERTRLRKEQEAKDDAQRAAQGLPSKLMEELWAKQPAISCGCKACIEVTSKVCVEVAPPPAEEAPILPVAPVKNASPKKLLFLHGYGESAYLLESFAMGGLRKAFPGIQLTILEGTIKLTTKEQFEVMPAGELREMAEMGDIEVFCHAVNDDATKKAFEDKTRDPNLTPAIDRLEAKLIKDGGYEILVGFSQGGSILDAILDRLPAINAKLPHNPVRMVGLFGAPLGNRPAPAAPLHGTVKAFVCQGQADSGYFCDACGGKIGGDYYNCDVCPDFDLCMACHKDHANAIKKLRPGMSHAVNHPMCYRPFDMFEIDKHKIVDRYTRAGIETQTSRCTGAHAMPQENDACYRKLRDFYLGAPATDKPGSKPNVDDALLKRIEASYERAKGKMFFEQPGEPTHWMRTGERGTPPNIGTAFDSSESKDDSSRKAALAALLGAKTANGLKTECTLSQAEWDVLKITDNLLVSHYVKVGNSYYQPALKVKPAEK